MSYELKRVKKILNNYVLEEGISNIILDYKKELKNEELFKYEYEGDYKKLINDYLNDKVKLKIGYFNKLVKEFGFEEDDINFNLEDYLNNEIIYKRINKLIKKNCRFYTYDNNYKLFIYEKIIDNNYNIIEELYEVFDNDFDNIKEIINGEIKIKKIINIINKFYFNKVIYNKKNYIFKSNLFIKIDLYKKLYNFLKILILNISIEKLIEYNLNIEIIEKNYLKIINCSDKKYYRF